MNKLFIFTIVFFITTISIFSQRNDGSRNVDVNLDRNLRIEREPVRTPSIDNPKNSDRVKQKNDNIVVYPKNPVSTNPPVISTPIEGNCIVEPTRLYPIHYTELPLSSYQIALKSYELGDYYEASLAFTKWLINNPKDVQALFYRGICYYEMKWYGYAIQDFDILLRIDIEYTDAYYYRGLCRFFRGERKLAQMDFEIAFELGNTIAGILLKRYF